MALMLGTSLGPYELTAKTGEGGRGEVYRARDTKLDRDVALKASCVWASGPIQHPSTRARGRDG